MKTARTVLLATLLFASEALAVDPPPPGGYPNGNTAAGEDALFSLTTGTDNTAVGIHALYSNTFGSINTAIGAHALESNSSGFSDGNVAVGAYALKNNISGFVNVSVGAYALGDNTSGTSNIAIGSYTLLNNTTGGGNVAVGGEALRNNEVGEGNVAIGVGALSVSKGYRNIALGNAAGYRIVNGSNNICIGHIGVTSDNNTIRIGKTGVHTSTNIAGISGVVVPNGVTVIVDTNGKLGTVVSSAAFKQDVKPMDDASEAILALQPVTFHYKKDLDPEAIPQFGLVAEQVEKVNPDLVARDDQGKPYTVRYEAVNAMLLNEFLKEHRKVEALEATVAAQQKGFESQLGALAAIVKAQTAQIQDVSDHLAGHKPPALAVADNP